MLTSYEINDPFRDIGGMVSHPLYILNHKKQVNIMHDLFRIVRNRRRNLQNDFAKRCIHRIIRHTNPSCLLNVPAQVTVHRTAEHILYRFQRVHNMVNRKALAVGHSTGHENFTDIRTLVSFSFHIGQDFQACRNNAQVTGNRLLTGN